MAPGLTTSKTISSRPQTAFSPQSKNLPAKSPNTPASLTKARGSRTRSKISSDLRAVMNSVGICCTNPVSTAIDFLNQARRRSPARAFLALVQTSSWPTNFMNPPIRLSAVGGTGWLVTGSLPSTTHRRS